MKKQKTEQQKLWDYLRKKLGNTKTAKEIFHRVSRKPKATEIKILYRVDTKELRKAVSLGRQLSKVVRGLKASKA